MNDATGEAVLVCTTEERLNDIIFRILEPKGFRLISALNQHFLFSLMEFYYPRVVIADTGLQNTMGFTLCKIIKGIERFRNTRVVLIRTGLSQANKDEGEHADAVLDMDSVSADLLAVISNYISCSGDVQITENAKRLARAIVSDIVHYNSEEACRSAAEGTFCETLSSEIEKGRAVYQQRISVNMPSMPDYFNDAIKDFINKIQKNNLVLP